MDFMDTLFLEPLRQGYFVKAMIGGGLVAVVSGVIGCLVVLRRMAFLGDALAHAMIAGVAGGYLVMKMLFGLEAHAPGMLLGSLLAAILTVMLIGFVSRVSRVKEDTAIGIMYTGVFAAGVVVVSIFRSYIHIDLMHFIMGDVLAVSDADLWASGVTASLVLGVVILFFRHFQLTSFDPVMAAAIGMPVVLIDYALTTCVSLVVVSAVNMVGVILVVGLLITPAATAYLLSDRLDRMMLLAAFFGLTSVIGGLYLCVWLDSAGGGAVMLFCTLQFLLVLVLAPKYGMLARSLRLRRMAPQQSIEDTLVAALRAGGTIPLAEVRALKPPVRKLSKVLRNIQDQGLGQEAGDSLKLSGQGRKEATRLLRAHRLWESYLEHLGTPGEAIHDKAHELEHIHDNEAVDYLDDLLEHPVTDPHGKEIPRDPDQARAGALASLSLLRQGDAGVVESVGSEAQGMGLKQGEVVAVGPRRDQGRTWVAVKGSGEEVGFGHTQADALLIRLKG